MTEDNDEDSEIEDETSIEGDLYGRLRNIKNYSIQMSKKIKEAVSIQNLKGYSNNLWINREFKEGEMLTIIDSLIEKCNKKILEIDPSYDLMSDDHLFFKKVAEENLKKSKA